VNGNVALDLLPIAEAQDTQVQNSIVAQLTPVVIKMSVRETEIREMEAWWIKSSQGVLGRIESYAVVSSQPQNRHPTQLLFMIQATNVQHHLLGLPRKQKPVYQTCELMKAHRKIEQKQ
jgi:hypothetical protein